MLATLGAFMVHTFSRIIVCMERGLFFDSVSSMMADEFPKNLEGSGHGLIRVFFMPGGSDKNCE
jgi:hypothetical protein